MRVLTRFERENLSLEDFLVDFTIDAEEELINLLKNEILKHHKGKQFLDAGYVFAPFISIIETPLISGPALPTMYLSKNRYSEKRINNKFYQRIDIMKNE